MQTTAEAVRSPRIGIFQPSQDRLEQLGVWYRAEYPALLRFAYLVSGRSAQAEDLVQESFVRLYRARARIDERRVGAYARTTILNLSRSAFRRRRSEERALGRIDRPEASRDADPTARDEMWRALLALSPRQRAVIALRFYEDMSERDIAATLGMSVGSVKQHTDRALSKLRARFGEGRQP